MKEKCIKWIRKHMVILIIVVVFFVLVYPIVYTEILKAAIRDDDVSRVKVLLVIPGDVNYRFSAPLLEAVGHTPLDVACMDDNYEMMKVLLQGGASPNAKQGHRQPIVYLLEGNYIGLFDRVELLVEHGADLSIKGDGGIVSILLTRSDYLRNASTLKEANAEVLKTLKYMVEHGANVEPEYRGAKYLTYVVENENYGVLDYLFDECGVDVNDSEPPYGETALMRAAKLGNLEMVDFLIGYGANASLHDDDGRTAADYAREEGFPDIAKHLEEIR